MLRAPPCHATQPQRVTGRLLAGEEITKAACGWKHTLVLTATGCALAWGAGAFGQLGTGGFGGACAPEAVAVPGGRVVVDVAAG